MLEVDVTEEAKQVALYRYELTGELYDDDEILNFSTTTSPSWSRSSASRSLRGLARRNDEFSPSGTTR